MLIKIVFAKLLLAIVGVLGYAYFLDHPGTQKSQHSVAQGENVHAPNAATPKPNPEKTEKTEKAKDVPAAATQQADTPAVSPPNVPEQQSQIWRQILEKLREERVPRKEEGIDAPKQTIHLR